MEKDDNLIRFDWAIKRLLRHKADHTILNGFLTSLLGRPIRILQILESESNRDYEENKSNRVDMLAEEEDGSKILIEVQNESEDAYFHRMIFGSSKVITQYIAKGDNYDKISKIYNINIVYFNLGEGEDYVYRGVTEFRGIHNNELLRLPPHMKVKYGVEEVSDLFPEYYVLRANDFDKWSSTPLDQWMYFLSTSKIPVDADAPGLKEAGEELRVSRLAPEEQNAYYRHLREMNSQKHLISDAWGRGHFEGRLEGRMEGIKEGKEEGREEEKWEMAKNLFKLGIDPETISKASGIPVEDLKSRL